MIFHKSFRITKAWIHFILFMGDVNMKNKIIFFVMAILIGITYFFYSYTETVLSSAKITKAIRANDIQKVEQLLKEHPDTVNKMDFIFPEWPEFHANYPLQVACEINNYEIAELLIHYGANVNLRSETGFTALTLAMRHSKDGKLVKLLLEHGADVVVPTRMEYNPLCASVWINKDADQEEKENSLAFFIYITEQYEKNGLQIQDDQIWNLDSILTYAAMENNLLVVQYLIENNFFSPNDVNAVGMNAVCRISSYANKNNDYTELIKYLLSVGCDPYLKDYAEKSAYDYAVEKNDTEMIKLIKSTTDRY